MPEAVVYIAASLDGFIAREDGSVDWLPDPPEGDDLGWSEFFPAIDALVMGRHTFEKLLTFDEWYYGDTPLIVMSSTLKAVPERLAGRAEVSKLEPGPLLDELGARGCKRVYVDGGRVVQSFLREDLIDELIVTTIPVLLGGGIPLYGELGTSLEWELERVEKLWGGLVKSHYRRAAR